MQRDTTPASSKVGAPVFKLIVVFAETTTLPLHKKKNKPPPQNCHLERSRSVHMHGDEAQRQMGFWVLLDVGFRGCSVSPLRESRQEPRYSLWFWPMTLWVPSGPLHAPATSLPQLFTHMLTARARWKSEADVNSCSASKLISLQERWFGVWQTIKSDEQQMAFPFVLNPF